jgi:hypothetical protein
MNGIHSRTVWWVCMEMQVHLGKLIGDFNMFDL